MKGTWSPQHPGSAGKGLWRHCLTNRGRPRLGTWSLWVLTNRHLGQSGNCLRCQETTDGVQATRKKKYLRTASHPHLKWKIGNFMQGKKKRLRLTWLAMSHWCSVKTHDKPGLIFHGRTRAGVRELCSLNRPLCLTSLLKTEVMDTGSLIASQDRTVHVEKTSNPAVHKWGYLKPSGWETHGP